MKNCKSLHAFRDRQRSRQVSAHRRARELFHALALRPPGFWYCWQNPGAGRPLLPLIRVRVVVMMVAMVPPVLLPFFLRIPMVISPMVIVALVPFGRMLPLVTSHPLPFFRRIPAVIIPMIPVLPIPFARMLLLAHSNPVRAY